ncbi:MAG: DUF4908 domain-containing protein [Parvularculaceae bacterium]
MGAAAAALSAPVWAAVWVQGEAPAAPGPAAPAVVVAAADPFSALVGKSRAGDAKGARDVQRYAVASDGRMFLVEGKVGEARLKYLCADGDRRLDCSLDPEAYAEEVFVATGSRGPRGDIIYKGESGELLLRIMSYGGATVFWPGKTNGEAASRSYGDDAALDLAPASSVDARRRADLASEKLRELIGEPVVFDIGASAPVMAARADLAPAAGTVAGEPPAEDATVLADAIMRAAAGLTEVAKDETGARVLRERIGRVAFTPGTPPRLSLDGKTLKVVYDPSADAAGRSSSRAVRQFLENSL